MHRPRSLLSILALVMLLTGLVPLAHASLPAHAGWVRRIVLISYDGSIETAGQLAARLDVWEVHPEQRSIVALVAAQEEEWLRAMGYSFEVAGAVDASTLDVLDPRYYYFDSYVPNANSLYMVDFLQQVNAAYPDLVELIDIGDAWEAGRGGHPRDLLVLRITNEDPRFGPVDDKPPFVLHANIHGREVTTSEMAIRYIKYLTSGYRAQGGYGLDPDVTWLVDWNRVYIEVSANPDGRAVNEQNINNQWRKNTDNDDGCGDPNGWGVDLNRNHSFKWSCCGGSSPDPCDWAYRGPYRASEPENDAFQTFASSIFQDWNGLNADDELPPAAPLTATGVLLTLHTYHDLVMWPWNFPPYPSPNDSQFRTIGHKLASLNDYYRPVGVNYTVDGCTMDWAYGKLGIASFTIEIGPDTGLCSLFFPAYECQDGIDGAERDFWQDNRPIFLYLHKIVRTPYVTAYGPDALAVAAIPDPLFPGQPLQLTATIQDSRYGTEPTWNIVGAEYFVDQPGEDGAGVPLEPVDGQWGGNPENVATTIDTSSLAPGTHYILVHGQSSNGAWGPLTAVFVHVDPGLCTPVADVQLAYTPTILLAGQPITFTGSASGTAPLYYSWAWGDDTTGSGATVQHTYADEGDYTVTLTISNGCSPDVFTSTLLSVCEQPHGLALEWTPAMPQANEPMTLTAVASGSAPIAISWDLGDGSHGSGSRLVHTYASAGTYRVTVAAVNECGTQLVRRDLVVDAPCTGAYAADFTWSPGMAPTGSRVVFQGTVQGTEPFTFTWDLGDGATASGAEITHSYTLAGMYTVTLTASNCGGEDLARASHAVIVANEYHVYLPVVAVH